MYAANGAARVFSAVWLPGLTSGMKFSSAARTRAALRANFPCRVDFCVCASRRSASASAPNRYSKSRSDSASLTRSPFFRRDGSLWAPRTGRACAISPSAALGSDGLAVSGVSSCCRLAGSRSASSDLRRVVLVLLGDLRVVVGRDVGRLAPQRRLLVLQLGDLLLVGAGLRIVAIRLVRRRRLALLRLLEVRVLGARLLVDAVVLLREVLRVGRRLDLLVVVEIDHLLVGLALAPVSAAAAPRPPARASASGFSAALSSAFFSASFCSGLRASARGAGGLGGSS